VTGIPCGNGIDTDGIAKTEADHFMNALAAENGST
jgi:hypothetical protein